MFVKIKLGKDGKKVKDKLKKLAAKVEEEDFSPDLEMVCWLVKFLLNYSIIAQFIHHVEHASK